MPLTPLGAREVGISAVVFCVGTIIFISLFRHSGSYWHLAPILPLALLFAWVLCFFRDPHRRVPSGPGVIVSPADGIVTHLDTAREDEYIAGEALRCSIFMSIFNVHINRAPAPGTIEFVAFRPGGFFDARREESLVKNQNQDIGIATSEPGMPAKMVVRQSTGAIARTIVCPVRKGMELRRGEKYGMIKFGSRVTLFMSPDAEVRWLVNVGDAVKGGETVLATILPASKEHD
ncbi:MAG: phosphatidylserine decarboxylase [Planctomycetota bacterium]|jgi:phosphatidylserine decarboxylase|nr:phosphatidylserine decarboxylase [Planctomycetota bacterium]